LVAAHHVGDRGAVGLGADRWVSTLICPEELFSHFLRSRRGDFGFSIALGDDPTPLFRRDMPMPPFSFALAEAEHRIQAGGATWSLHLHTLPFPFGAQAALPLFLFFGALGASLLLHGLSRAEARERFLAEEMLQIFRVGLRESSFLAEASRLLVARTDLEPSLEAIAEQAVPLLGAGCGICILEGEQHVRIHVAHGDEEVQRRLRRLYGAPIRVPGFHSLLLEMDRKNLKRIPEDLFESRLIASSPDELRDELRSTLRWCVIVPMLARGRAIGAVVVRMGKERRYGPKELALIHDFASRIGLALDNARLLQRSHRAIQIRDEFLSVASHELLTPLTALQANVQSLIRQRRAGEPVDPERLERGLDIADRQVQRLTRLVRELLDVTRIESGRSRLERETFDLAELVAELALRYREEAERRGSEMHVDAPLGAVGSWDRNRLEQVFTNLLSNAIKYGNAHPIHIEVRHDATTALVVVRDEGIGIPAEALGTIFQRFERVAPTHGYGGLGLGLYIAKQIAEAHGGTIEVESELGKGSRFSLILQREPAPLSADERQVQGAHQR
jgi:signal transduction histidine kinase